MYVAIDCCIRTSIKSLLFGVICTHMSFCPVIGWGKTMEFVAKLNHACVCGLIVSVQMHNAALKYNLVILNFKSQIKVLTKIYVT